MATPFESGTCFDPLPTGKRPRADSSSSSQRLDSSDISSLAGLGKRVRRSLASLPPKEPISSSVLNLIDEPPVKNRRVDPVRLAAKLGPELVAEMDKLIQPGGKMPPFDVRKTLHDRFNVDRRHVYDYFHSKGLRVVREDKHGNLARGRNSLRERSNLAAQAGTKLPAVAPVRKVKAVRPKKRLPSPIPRLVVNVPSEPVRSSPPMWTPDLSEGSGSSAPMWTPELSEGSSTSTFPTMYRFTDPMLSSPPVGLSDPDGSHMDLLDENDTFSLMYPDDGPSYHDDYTIHTSEPLMELFDLPVEVLASSDDEPASHAYTVDGGNPMSEAERTAFYNLVSDSIGPAQGIQECLGTYQAYMEEQSRLYFDRLFPTVRRTAYSYKPIPAPSATQLRPQAPAPSTSSVPFEASSFDVDFRRWLSTAGASVDFETPETKIPDSSFSSAYTSSAKPNTASHLHTTPEPDQLQPRKLPSPHTDSVRAVYAPTKLIPISSSTQENDIKEPNNLVGTKRITPQDPGLSPVSAKPLALDSIYSRFKRSAKFHMLFPPPIVRTSSTPVFAGYDFQAAASALNSSPRPQGEDFSVRYSSPNGNPRAKRTRSFGTWHMRIRTASAGSGV